jgi:hypothetical protein
MTSVNEVTRRRRLVRFGLLAVLAVLAVGALLLVAAHHPADYTIFPKCHLYLLTGLHCPGCGLTRSVHALLNGRFSQALAYNVLSPVILPLIAISVTRSLWLWAWGAEAKPGRGPRRWPAWVPVLLTVVLLAYGVARNIPYHPFTLLAPHELR